MIVAEEKPKAYQAYAYDIFDTDWAICASSHINAWLWRLKNSTPTRTNLELDKIAFLPQKHIACVLISTRAQLNEFFSWQLQTECSVKI